MYIYRERERERERVRERLWRAYNGGGVTDVNPRARFPETE